MNTTASLTSDDDNTTLHTTNNNSTTHVAQAMPCQLLAKYTISNTGTATTIVVPNHIIIPSTITASCLQPKHMIYFFQAYYPPQNKLILSLM